MYPKYEQKKTGQLWILLIKFFHQTKIAFLQILGWPYNRSMRKAAIRLRLEVGSLPLLPQQVEPAWTNYLIQLHSDIQSKNPIFFLNWDSIKSSMFNEPPCIELQTLKSSSHWQTWQKTLREDRVGYPRPYPYLFGSSGNLVHNAYVLERAWSFLPHLDFSKIQHIFEFGGGYGSMCRLLCNLGFPDQYVIFDLSEFSYLQEYFLTSLSHPLEVKLEPAKAVRVILLRTLNELAQQDKLTNDWDLFLATWSLSESPIELRVRILDLIESPRYFLIAFQARFGELDNLTYFQNLIKEKQSYRWELEEIKHIPGNFLLIGERQLN